MLLKLETISAEYLTECPLTFTGRTTPDVVRAYEAKAACDDSDKAAARAEIRALKD